MSCGAAATTSRGGEVATAIVEGNNKLQRVKSRSCFWRILAAGLVSIFLRSFFDDHQWLVDHRHFV